MGYQVDGPGIRSHRVEANPETQAYPLPGSAGVAVMVDLGSTRLTLNYDPMHAEALHRELGVAIELIGVEPRPSYRERMGK